MTKCRTLDGMSLEEALADNQKRMNKLSGKTRTEKVIESLDNHPNKREVLQLARQQLEDIHNTTIIKTTNV
jgi:hypothetical protein